MATLDDIARELGISKSTVSKALNGAKDVSKAMRQNVLEKAVEMGYSRAARSAEQPRLAVFVINMEYTKPEDFGYDIVMGFRQAAEPSGYQVEMIPLTQQLNKEGSTVILITHDNGIAATARRIVRLADGKIVEDREQEVDWL